MSTDSIRLHYRVQDRATQGIDFMLWGIDDEDCGPEAPQQALVSLRDALSDGLDVELVVTRYDGPRDGEG